MAKKKKSRRAKKVTTFERRWHELGANIASSDKVYISGSELRLLVTEQLTPKLSDNFGFYIADGQYFCPPLADAREIIKASALDRKIWVEERFDCDDFAHVLKAHFAEAAYRDGQRRAAHCFGVVWGQLPGPHAINWMITSDLKLRFVEPQNDRIFLPRTDDRDIYFMLI